jgi:hypothetical protein
VVTIRRALTISKMLPRLRGDRAIRSASLAPDGMASAVSGESADTMIESFGIVGRVGRVG